MDTAGHLTVGYGHRLDRPIGPREADALFLSDYAAAKLCADRVTGWKLSNRNGALHARFGVIVEMCFQLGESGVRGFRKMLAALDAGDWDKAADEMLDSKWAQQAPDRAHTLARIMRTGLDTP